MWRRLGQSGYRAESPQHNYMGSISYSRQSDFSLPSTDYLDAVSMMSLNFDEEQQVPERSIKKSESIKLERLVEKSELAIIVGNICRKLDKIVNLVSDFTSDAVSLRESAQDLLEELHNRVLPYLIKLDIEIKSAESVIRYNIDRTNISGTRINWLLEYNKYLTELKRVFKELSETVYNDLDESLDFRFRGIIGCRPSSESVENLAAMKSGMRRAMQLLCDKKRMDC